MKQGWVVTLDVAEVLSMENCHGYSPHTPSQHRGPDVSSSVPQACTPL